MATSICASSGSRVVIFWKRKPGSRNTRRGPVVQKRALRRCSSKLRAEMNGRSAMRSPSSMAQPRGPEAFGSTSGATSEPATMDTRMTTTKKVVPQRGCSVVCARTFSTVSGRPCS
jgi:hypothetical protein